MTLIHEGKGFSLSPVLTVAIAGTPTFVGYPDGINVHFHDMALDADAGPILIEFIENPTVPVQGTLAEVYNRRRDSSNSARMKVYQGATVTGGTVLFSKVMYGSSAGINSEAKEGVIRGEWDLAPGSVYAIRLTNQSGQEISISADMHFYEDEI
jgi:hypothetical protein